MDTKQSYLSWLTKVDIKVFKTLQLHIEDLPDELYRDNYDENTTVDDMAKIVIDNNKILFE